MSTKDTGTEWLIRKRDYDLEHNKLKSELVTTTEHPLRGTIVTKLASTHISSAAPAASVKPQPTDPLSMFATEAEGLDGSDPLSMIARGEDKPPSPTPSFGRARSGSKTSIASNKFGDQDGYIDETFEPWLSKRAGILSKYTTSEKLSITTSFLAGSEQEKIVVKQQTTAADKMKNRLEQLDDFEEGSLKEMLNLSQAEYVNRIEELNTALLTAWNGDQRVKSLKIAIQCAKLLGDVSVMQFYPSKFVLVTDILDNFGNLVFNRIRDKSVTYTAGSNTPRSLPENFSPDEVPDAAKETCRNWFYKVASIRELTPRLYVEMAIMKCYNFLTTGEYSQALVRIAHQIRGIGDPLTATYARAYLCRVGINVAPKVTDHLNPCLFDFLTTYKQLKEDYVQNSLAKQSLEMSTYLQLFPPALDWILQCIAYKASETTLTDILERCKTCNSALLLNAVVSAFNPKYIALRALDFNGLIKECEESGFPKYHLYMRLGTSIILEEPPEEQKLQILNEVWKVVMKLKDPTSYILCAEIWIEYPLKHFTGHEVNALLGNIIKHMNPNRSFENHYPQLLSILSKVVTSMNDYKLLFGMDNFLPFMDMFQKESVKVDASKCIMGVCTRMTSEISDPVLINALVAICKTMHDSVNALSLEDDRRVIGNLISTFLRTVSYGRDFEKQLNFYVDARAQFSNLEVVLVMLVQSVSRLAMRTRQVVKGNHSRKTAAFVRACNAYCFITIPSMMDIFTRLKLYLLCGQVALANQAVGQADAFLRATINLLPDVPKLIEVENKSKSSEQYFVEYINSLLSVLLIVPDHPDHGVLYLMRGLLNVLQDYKWEENSDSKIRVYLNAICLLSAASQEIYIYQLSKIDSNDKLYGSSKKFLAEIVSIIDTLVQEIMEKLKDIGNKSLKKQAFLSLAFFNRMLSHADMTSQPMQALGANLWRLAEQHGQADKQFMERLRKHVQNRTASEPQLQTLLQSMKYR